jgi:hypothetical protein
LDILPQLQKSEEFEINIATADTPSAEQASAKVSAWFDNTSERGAIFWDSK